MIKGMMKCEKHRAISLMSHATKLVLRNVINRIRGRTLHEIAPEQCEFKADKVIVRQPKPIFWLKPDLMDIFFSLD